MFDVLGVRDRVAAGEEPPFVAAPGLGALTDGELLGLGAAEAEAVVEVTQRAMAALAAVQALAVEAFTRREQEAIEEFEARCRAAGTPGMTRVADDFVPSMLAPRLRVAPRTMATRLEQVRTLVNELPATLAHLRAGRIDDFRARVIASEAAELEPGLRARFDETLHEGAGARAGASTALELTPSRLRERCQRLVLQADPRSALRRARSAREERHVRVGPGLEPGMTSWSASQPAESSLAA